ncbi:MAG: hypothetical protein Q4B28_03040 [bacterium]|nr:hypothetical protein [bacterium]
MVKNVFDTLDNRDYPTLIPLSSKLLITNFGTPSAALHQSSSTLTRRIPDITTFGEYKVALERVDYEVCNGKDEKGKPLTTKQYTDDRICEVDFAVTDPYLIQKSPYGIGNKATTNLNIYKLKNGATFMDRFFSTQTISEKAYDAPANIEKLFTTFKNKYQRIAKSLGNGLSKVPGKSIYFYSGDEDITSVLGKDVIAKPFTLIASKGQDLKIKGSLYTNAMIMTAGKIHIDASASCNGNASKYGQAGQLLQGIFYAGKGFKSIGHESLKNTLANLDKGEWCNYGNLHIKGVAIGDLSDMVENRRSELYTWFQGSTGGQGAAEKVNKILNGASVLIDYNPGLRGQLPPGAEEFNKALEVYRK